MARLIYVLDANVISDVLMRRQIVRDRLAQVVNQGNNLCLCQPVYFELMRGLLKINAIQKLNTLQTRVVPRMTWVSLTDADWEQAARFWADAASRGRQLSDMDLLIAAAAHRLGGILVSSDADFDALTLPREDWRAPSE